MTEIETIKYCKEKYPKQWIIYIKKHYPQIWDKIEKHNIKYFGNLSSNVQKVFNYINNITQIPLCPITQKPLKFWDLKFTYRKYAVKGHILPESRVISSQKLKGHKGIRPPDFTQIEINEPIIFNDIYNEYINVTSDCKRNVDKINRLSFKYPKLKKKIWLFYNKQEPFFCNLWLLERKLEKIPDNYKWNKWTYAFEEDISPQEKALKNKIEKYNNAIIYDKQDTIEKIKKYLKLLPNYQNIKQSFFKIDINIIKSIYFYTPQMNDIDNKFAERVYFLLYGKPENKNTDDYKIVFTTFENGYEIRSKDSFASAGELELKQWLHSLNFECEKYNDKKYEIDIYLSKYNLGIEYNGEYWHSTRYKDKKYHFNKWKYFKDKNIHLIQIWNNEWKNKNEIVKSMILNRLNICSQKIFARKCIIKEIKNKNEKNTFLNKNHLQGSDNSSYWLGLYYNNELVSIMTFGKRNSGKQTHYELIRFCNKLNTVVVGAASKLLKYFLNTHPDIYNIKTFADLRFYKDTGFYNKLGFTFTHTSQPNYFYVKPNEGCMNHYSRLQFQKHKLSKLLSNFNINLTEEQNMINNGYLKIYDCGNYVFEYYTKKSS